MRQFRTEAIILRRTNYGEADRILNVLTPSEGKVSAIAKGVRRPKSKLAGGLELFAICDVTILYGKSDMGVVTSARIKDFYGDILHDYDRMQLAYEVIKRINKATETVTDIEFYNLLRDSLKYLGDTTISWRLIELWFDLRLASVLGGGINLSTDRAGDQLNADERYAYDSSDKVFYIYSGGTFGADSIKLLRLAASKNPDVLSKIGGLEDIDWTGLTRIARQD